MWIWKTYYTKIFSNNSKKKSKQISVLEHFLQIYFWDITNAFLFSGDEYIKSYAAASTGNKSESTTAGYGGELRVCRFSLQPHARPGDFTD